MQKYIQLAEGEAEEHEDSLIRIVEEVCKLKHIVARKDKYLCTVAESSSLLLERHNQGVATLKTCIMDHVAPRKGLKEKLSQFVQ